MFTTFIRPHVEFATTVFNPTTIGLVRRLENVQRQFTKAIPSISALSYQERCRILGIDTLAFRRTVNDLVMTHRLLSTNIPGIDHVSFFSKSANIGHTRGHALKLEHHRVLSRARGSFLGGRSVELWNQLDSDVILMSTKGFKNALLSSQRPKLNSFLSKRFPRLIE